MEPTIHSSALSKNLCRGYAAILVILVLGGSALSAALALSEVALFHESEQTMIESSYQAREDAYSCLTEALKRMSVDADYDVSEGGESISMFGRTCRIVSIEKSSETVLEVEGSAGQSKRIYKAIVGGLPNAPQIISVYEE